MQKRSFRKWFARFEKLSKPQRQAVLAHLHPALALDRLCAAIRGRHIGAPVLPRLRGRTASWARPQPGPAALPLPCQRQDLQPADRHSARAPAPARPLARSPAAHAGCAARSTCKTSMATSAVCARGWSSSCERRWAASTRNADSAKSNAGKGRHSGGKQLQRFNDAWRAAGSGLRAACCAWPAAGTSWSAIPPGRARRG